MRKIKSLFRALRPHQWAKGVFVLLPMVFGMKLSDEGAVVRTAAAFLIFSFLASAMYLLNDVMDVEEDRSHPEKKNRPIASGELKVSEVIAASILCLVVMIPAAFLLDRSFGYLTIVYLALNYTYMRYLKHAVIIDVFCIGTFFYLRILAGAIVSDVVLSNWIVMCTVLLALFIAFNKRRFDYEYSKDTREVFTKYTQYFLDRMISIVSSSIVIAYALYTMDRETTERFGTNRLIYTIPFVYYGIFRYLYLIDTKWYGGDPAKILIKDYKMVINMFLWLATSIGVIYFSI